MAESINEKFLRPIIEKLAELVGVKSTMENKMAEDQYLKCTCGHENFVDPNCEVPPSEYHCDECGKELRGQA